MNPHDPNTPNEFDITIFGLRIRARGLVPVIVAAVVVLAIVFKTDMPDVREWIRLASRV